MAEIDIERKSTPIWPWLIGLAALVAVVLVWTMSDREPAEETAGLQTAAEAPVGTAGRMGDAAAGGAVDEYVAFVGVAEGEQRGEMGRDHEYTAEGIRKLRGALQTVVERNGSADANVRFDRFREVADRIEQDPTSGAHAGQVRDAFTRAASVMESLGNAPSVPQLQQTANSINPDQPLLDQREKVHSFFRQSAESIQTLARR